MHESDLIRSSVQRPFIQKKYAVITSILVGTELDRLYSYVLEAAARGQLSTNSDQVPNTPFAYGDELMEHLLESLRPRIEIETGIQLFSSYSYFRVYKSGDVLKKHVDRPACEISVTLSLGYEAEKPWAIWLRSEDGDVSIDLNPGDALLYQGTELIHWREPFDGSHAAQVFLHYVDKNGPHTAWKYDGRPALGMPPRTRGVS